MKFQSTSRFKKNKINFFNILIFILSILISILSLILFNNLYSFPKSNTTNNQSKNQIKLNNLDILKSKSVLNLFQAMKLYQKMLDLTMYANEIQINLKQSNSEIFTINKLQKYSLHEKIEILINNLYPIQYESNEIQTTVKFNKTRLKNEFEKGWNQSQKKIEEDKKKKGVPIK